MSTLFTRRLFLLTSCLVLPLAGKSQLVFQSGNQAIERIDTLDLVVTYPQDRIRDSLEVMMLKLTRSYQHVERLLACFPADSRYLSLLPAVLPVDLPIQAFRVTSGFGMRQHPVHKQIRFHAGVDVKASIGMVVKATAPGVVCESGYDSSLGAYVRIEHAFGFETTYGHLAGYCVKPGQTITRNEQIGKVGNTGLATGPHLHYTIKKNGSAVDPFDFCFLLRRRLWIHEKSKISGASASELAKGLSSKVE